MVFSLTAEYHKKTHNFGGVKFRGAPGILYCHFSLLTTPPCKRCNISNIRNKRRKGESNKPFLGAGPESYE